MFEQTPAQIAKLKPQKEAGEDIYRPLSKLCIFAAWVMLVVGVLGFLVNIGMKNNQVIALLSLGLGAVSFVVIGVLGEISTHLAFIRGQLKS